MLKLKTHIAWKDQKEGSKSVQNWIIRVVHKLRMLKIKRVFASLLQISLFELIQLRWFASQNRSHFTGWIRSSNVPFNRWINLNANQHIYFSRRVSHYWTEFKSVSLSKWILWICKKKKSGIFISTTVTHYFKINEKNL